MKKYIITSERGFYMDDEYRNVFETTKDLSVGDVVVLDGLKWYVEEVEEENTNKITSEYIAKIIEVMDNHGYKFCDHIDYDFADQFVTVESTTDFGRIITWIFAVPKRENFKAVLKSSMRW